MDLSTKRARDRLRPRNEPWWSKMGRGCALGFRVPAGTWVARWRGPDGRQHYAALGELPTFDEARRAAAEFFAVMGGAGAAAPVRATVSDALEAYRLALEARGRYGTALEVGTRFRRTVAGDPLGELPLESVRRRHVLAWRDRLHAGRSARTVNRDARAVLAGVRFAVRELGFVADRSAWQLEALPDDGEAPGRRAVYLDGRQRRALRAVAGRSFRAFLRGLEETGARPGELAAAVAGDLRPGGLVLRSHKGRRSVLRERVAEVSPRAARWLARVAGGRPAGVALFLDEAGRAWRRESWSRAFREAAAVLNARESDRVRIPAGASCYSVRHAYISELLQLRGADPLTVAAQTGTSLAMLERAYFHAIPGRLRGILAARDGSGA